MSFCVRTQFRLTVVAGLGLAAGSFARAETLISKSPFLSGDAPVQAAPTATTDGPIQLSAIFGDADGAKIYGIYSSQLKRTKYVKLNERGTFQANSAPFTVTQTKVVDGVDQVTVNYQGQQLVLALKASKIASNTPPGQPGAARGGPPTPATPAAQQPGARGGGPGGQTGPGGPGGGGRGGGGGGQGGAPGQGPGGRGGGPGGPGGGQAPAATAEQVANANAILQARQAQRSTAAATGQPAVVTNPTTSTTRGARGGGAAAPAAGAGRRGQ